MESITYIPHPMTPDIISVEVREDYSLQLIFADGTEKCFDFRPLLDWPCYQPLKNESVFRLARVENGTVTWPNNIDVDPEILYA